MPISDIDIYNQSLIAAGADPILSFAGTAKENTLGNFLFPRLRNQEISKFLWNFAIERASLGASTELPVYGYEHKIPFPPDLLRLLAVESTKLVPSIRSIGNLDFGAYKVEGRFILTNEAPVNLKYLKEVTDPTLFSQMYVSTLVARIAAELAIPLRQDRALAEDLADKYESIASTARFSDATEDAPVRLEADDLIIARGDFNITQIPRRL